MVIVYSQVVWRKATNPEPVMIGEVIFTSDTRFEIAHIPEKGEWNLIIKDVKHTDAGMYECQVSSKEKNIRRLLRVTIKGN